MAIQSRLNLYIADPATRVKANALVKQRGLNSISELFELLVTAEGKRKRGVRRGKAVVS